MARKARISDKFTVVSRDTFTQGELDDMVEAALEGDNENLLRLALSAGGSANGVHGTQLTPLVNAAEDGKTGMMRLLLDAKADIDLPGRPSGVTALIQTIVFNHYEGLTLLLERKADVNKQDGRGRTPAYAAVEMMDLLALSKLVKAGADVTIPDKNGVTPLALAKQKLSSGLLTRVGMDAAARVITLLEMAPAVAKPAASAAKPAP